MLDALRSGGDPLGFPFKSEGNKCKSYFAANVPIPKKTEERNQLAMKNIITCIATARYVANISHCFDVMERVAYVRKWAAPDADGRRICLARPCVCYRMSPVKYVHIGEGELRRRLITFPTLSRLSRLRISFHQCSGPVIFLLFFFSLRGPSIC